MAGSQALSRWRDGGHAVTHHTSPPHTITHTAPWSGLWALVIYIISACRLTGLENCVKVWPPHIITWVVDFLLWLINSGCLDANMTDSLFVKLRAILMLLIRIWKCLKNYGPSLTVDSPAGDECWSTLSARSQRGPAWNSSYSLASLSSGIVSILFGLGHSSSVSFNFEVLQQTFIWE